MKGECGFSGVVRTDEATKSFIKSQDGLSQGKGFFFS